MKVLFQALFALFVVQAAHAATVEMVNYNPFPSAGKLSSYEVRLNGFGNITPAVVAVATQNPNHGCSMPGAGASWQQQAVYASCLLNNFTYVVSLPAPTLDADGVLAVRARLQTPGSGLLYLAFAAVYAGPNNSLQITLSNVTKLTPRIPAPATTTNQLTDPVTGVVWNFNQVPHSSGYYVDGTPWVRLAPQSTLHLTSIAPAMNNGRHGMQNRVSFGFTAQGFDSRLSWITYNANLSVNVSTGAPFPLNCGDALIKAVSADTPAWLQYISKYSVLHVVCGALDPDPNDFPDTIYGPPGTSRGYQLSADGLRTDIFGNLDLNLLSNLPSFSAAENIALYFHGIPNDRGGGPGLNELRAQLATERLHSPGSFAGYGGEYQRLLHQQLMFLHAKNITLENKWRLLMRVLSIALLYDDAVRIAGYGFGPSGGQNSGVLSLLELLAVVGRRADVKNWVRAHPDLLSEIGYVHAGPFGAFFSARTPPSQSSQNFIQEVNYYTTTVSYQNNCYPGGVLVSPNCHQNYNSDPFGYSDGGFVTQQSGSPYQQLSTDSQQAIAMWWALAPALRAVHVPERAQALEQYIVRAIHIGQLVSDPCQPIDLGGGRDPNTNDCILDVNVIPSSVVRVNGKIVSYQCQSGQSCGRFAGVVAPQPLGGLAQNYPHNPLADLWNVLGL
ncbi:MAG: hypothetical protein K1X79_12710 [Oligoflexia bacterium]|nr:hypothetical protein [Oligoflexia bacterium]